VRVQEEAEGVDPIPWHMLLNLKIEINIFVQRYVCKWDR
jgi:hypothetical protein